MIGFEPGNEPAMRRAEASAIEQIRSAIARRPDIDLDDEAQVSALFEEVEQTLSEDEQQAIGYEWLHELAEELNREEVPHEQLPWGVRSCGVWRRLWR
jgi:hypothetical protein